MRYEILLGQDEILLKIFRREWGEPADDGRKMAGCRRTKLGF
jgi:hypothetical protein